MTSIEWLEIELLNKRNGTPIIDKALFDKAKEMHEIEIKLAFADGEINVWDRKVEGQLFKYGSHEHYYKEKFKNQKTI